MPHIFYLGDVIKVLRQLEPESVHCVVTSPPYWGLRDYGVDGQIGLEKTPEEYVAKMVEVFREVRRVLRKEGTCWINLGDTFAANRGYQVPDSKWRDVGNNHCSKVPAGFKPKDLIGIPWRVAFALQADGYYLRSDIIWNKSNAMPESVTDRPTKAHEYVFLLTKSERYFYDADAIREPHKEASFKRYKYGLNSVYKNAGNYGGKQSHNFADADRLGDYINLTGRNKRSVWTIPTEPFPDAHFATFPTALVEPCIKAGTSEYGCCPKCGAPWKRIVEHKKPTNAKPKKATEQWNSGTGLKPHKCYRGTPISDFKSWQPTCSCGIEETVPCVVLDPFGGSGTVSLVARQLGRSSIYIDLNPEYLEIAKRRLNLEQIDLFEQYEFRVVS